LPLLLGVFPRFAAVVAASIYVSMALRSWWKYLAIPVALTGLGLAGVLSAPPPMWREVILQPALGIAVGVAVAALTLTCGEETRRRFLEREMGDGLKVEPLKAGG